MRKSYQSKPFPIHILVFLAPAVLIYTLFMVYPLLDSLRLSFFSTTEGNQELFAGIQNYITLFTDSNYAPRFWGALKNNLVFFTIHMVVQNSIGLLLAALLASGIKGSSLYRAVLFMPTVLSVVIIGFIWQLILNPLWGVAESILQAVSLENLFKPWLGLPETALITISLISVWQFVGIPMILFFAALISIPEELMEAARVDGASGWQTFRRVLLPLSMPGVIAGSILVFVPSLGAYVTPAILGGAKSTLLGSYIVTQFLTARNWPVGASLSFVLMAVMLAATLVYFRSGGRNL